jgi:hypothetical protein
LAHTHHSPRQDATTRRTALLAAAGLALGGCISKQDNNQPSIKFTRVPQSDPGGRQPHDIIEGSVTGNVPGDQIVLYAKSGKWWVQPLVARPFTKIVPNSQGNPIWTSATHLGMEYAALLVKPGYKPANTLDALPTPGGLVAAVATVKGQSSPPSPMIGFSGYQWRVRDRPSSRGGAFNEYSPKNAWTDANGAMHLRISKIANRWNCAEVSLSRSLGYGTYSFTVRDTSNLDPSAVFGMFTWDYAQPDQNFSEVDIEISRWGDPNNKNAQFTVQPHYLPANVAHFSAPPGILTHSFHWEHGRIAFRTSRGAEPRGTSSTVAEHVFTSGIPTPAIESVRMNLYIYGESRIPFGNGAEVVIEKFEYLP